MTLSELLTYRPGRRGGFLRRIVIANSLHRQRRALATLPPERLADLDLSQEAATAEARRPVWDVPRSWLA